MSDSALDRELAGEMAQWEAAGLRRALRPGGSIGADFTSNDYLGLARHPDVVDAARRALEEHGAGGRASRLLGGGSTLDDRAEQAAAEWLGAEAALLFPSGYQANLGLVGALASRGDALVCDELVHASLIDAARLSRATVLVHRHLDLEHAAMLLSRAAGARRRLVLTESVFSMDGDAAPLAALVELCERHDAHLVVDEAHAAGVLGPRGAGAWSAAAADGLPSARLAARVVTGGKALGVSGGFVVGSAALRDHLLNRARSFMFTTAPSPAVAGALIVAVGLAQAGDDLRRRLAARAVQLSRGLGRPAPAAAILPILVGDSVGAVALATRLQEEGLDVRAVRPPAVPHGAARLRLVVHAGNEEADVTRLVGALRPMLGTASIRASREAAPHLLAVVGTDTGVGKTVVSALLLRAAARAPGMTASYWKPVQTGTDSDTEEVRRLLAGAPSESVSLRAPMHELALPASPHEAAAAAGTRIDVDALVAEIRDLGASARLHVIELAGGLLVPYDDVHTQADVLARVGCPVVLVARSGLGTLNHSLLTLEALAARGMVVRALFLVGPPHPSNRATLARMAGVPLVFELPPLSAGPGVAPDAAALDAWLARHDLAQVLGP